MHLPIILIPTFQPEQILIELVKEIIKQDPLQNIVVVNDGSDKSYDEIFSAIEQFKQVTLLSHHSNQGKGAALKTGIKYILNTYNKHSCPGVITVDADGQHHVDDVMKILHAMQKDPSKLYLGTREFIKDNAPWRSRFGNKLTKLITQKIYRLPITDTQSGLRGMPFDFIKHCLTLKGQAYDFEMEVLLSLKHSKLNVEEIPIRTIYLNNNESSHFNPLLDSVKIYCAFMRFIKPRKSS